MTSAEPVSPALTAALNSVLRVVNWMTLVIVLVALLCGACCAVALLWERAHSAHRRRHRIDRAAVHREAASGIAEIEGFLATRAGSADDSSEPE